MFLEEDPQPAITFLNVFMQLPEHFAEDISQSRQSQPAGNENVGKPAIQSDDHDQSGNQAHNRPDQSGQDLDCPVGDNRCIIRQPVHPFRGMDSGNSRIVFSGEYYSTAAV